MARTLRTGMLRRFGCIVGLVLVCFALIAFLVINWLSRMAPTWYAPPDASSSAIATIADDFEYDLVEKAQRQRDRADANWTATITEQQVNAWLVNRLPKWIAHDPDLHWPANLGTPQVKIEQAGISVALPMGGSAQRTVVARLIPELQDGKLRLRINHLAVGRIAMPGEPLANLVKTIEDLAPQAMDDPRLKQAIDILSGEQAIDPELKLEDGRRIRLTRVQLSFRKMDLTAITESRNAR